MKTIRLPDGRRIGPGHPVYVIAEMSANHGGSFEKAVDILRAAKAAGADAVKLQTYTADTLTLDSDREDFRIGGGTLWDGRTLHDLYEEAATPWEWHPELARIAKELGLDLFSSPFDETAVDFLETQDVPLYKVASFEIVDLSLIRRIAATGKPMIISTGLATKEEIAEAVQAAADAGGREIALLKCTSAYPAAPSDMHLRTIPDLQRSFGVPVGLSDHTEGIAVPVAAVALGACIVEKHFTLSRQIETADSAFSLEPAEFGNMVAEIRMAEAALGDVHYGGAAREEKSRKFRRSLFVVRDMPEGTPFSAENVRSIRPGNGLPPKFLPRILGRHAARAIPRGTPLSWELVAGEKDSPALGDSGDGGGA
jgi:pseudaminic acid synthase